MTRGTKEAKRTRENFRNICGKYQTDPMFVHGYPSLFIMGYIVNKRKGIVVPDNELANLLEEAKLAEKRAEEEAEAAYQAKVAYIEAQRAAAIKAAAAAIEARNAAIEAAAPIGFTINIGEDALKGHIVYSTNKGFSIEWLNPDSGVIHGEENFFCDDGICVFSYCIELSNLLSFIFVKLSLDGETPIIQSWVITLPRMSHWEDVSFEKFNKVDVKEQVLNANLTFAVKIDDESHCMELIYDSKGGYEDSMDCSSIPLFATSEFEASNNASEKKVGEVMLLDSDLLFETLQTLIFEN